MSKKDLTDLEALIDIGSLFHHLEAITVRTASTVFMLAFLES